MIDARLSRLLAFSEDEVPSKICETDYREEYVNTWIFRPTGEVRGRIFFLWINDDRSIGGSRCTDTAGVEPWRFVAHLPQRMVRHMLACLPPEEIAQATASFLTK